MKPPSGPQSVIWFLALNSYKRDSASVVASAFDNVNVIAHTIGFVSPVDVHDFD